MCDETPTAEDATQETAPIEEETAWMEESPLVLPEPPDEPAETVPMTIGPEVAHATGAGPESGDRILEGIQALGDSLGRQLEALRVLFDREIRAEATREKVVDRLHAELQQYKQDLLLQTLRPIFIDLVQLHDDIGKIVDSPDPELTGSASRLLGLMRGLQQGIEDILYRQGVEPFEVGGEAFDPRRQRAVATVPSDEPQRAKTVATRHRKGFQAGEKLIRPEIVSVYAWKKPEPSPDPADS
jgi:molecular chaperone GrpE